MAQIINKSITTSPSAARTAMIDDLRSVFTFTRYDEENHRLYITDNTYIGISGQSSSFYLRFGNANGQLLLISQSSYDSVYYQIITSVSGDVIVRFSNQTLVDNKYLQFAIVKVKDSSNNESWGFYIPGSITSSTQNSFNTINQGYMTLLADDNTTIETTKVNLTLDGSSTSMYPVYSGFNNDAIDTKLLPIYNTYTAFVTVNTKIVALSPHVYNGNCTINNHNYYCISPLATLDE